MALSKPLRMASLLIDMEAVLRNMQCWDDQAPAQEALQSREPFCVDTLEFYQWLQWIFIPRIYHNIREGNPLPEQCNIAPIAEEWLRLRSLNAEGLMKVLADIDQVLSEPNQGQ